MGEQDYFHRRVEDERCPAVRAGDPVLVEYKFGGTFHRADILTQPFWMMRCVPDGTSTSERLLNANRHLLAQ